MKIHVNKLCNFKSNMRESSCQSKKQVMVVWNWSSGELCGPWASCFILKHGCRQGGLISSNPVLIRREDNIKGIKINEKEFKIINMLMILSCF